jgi:hypothetical protein
LIPTYISLKDGSEFALYDYISNYTRRWPCAIARALLSIIYFKFSIFFQRREPLQNNNLILGLPIEDLNVWKYAVCGKLLFDKIGNTIIIENVDEIEYKKR